MWVEIELVMFSLLGRVSNQKMDGRTVDSYAYSQRRSNYYGSRREREPKLFSHRFHFSHPSTLTLTVTHKDGFVVMYARKGTLYLSITEGEFRDLVGAVNEVREKVKQCKRVLRGMEPPPVDVEDQSSAIPKSESTRKIEREATKRARARQLALMDASTEEEGDDDESLGVPSRKISRRKARPVALKKQQPQPSGTVGDDEDTDG